MYTVYVLYSLKHRKTYTGFSGDFEKRFKSHNELGTKDWATRYRPWEILHTEQFETKAEAISRERYFKSGIGRTQIKIMIQKNFF